MSHLDWSGLKFKLLKNTIIILLQQKNTVIFLFIYLNQQTKN